MYARVRAEQIRALQRWYALPSPPLAVVRPPGARPHRPGPDDEEKAASRTAPDVVPVGTALHVHLRPLALGAAMVAVALAVLGAVAIDSGGTPVVPLLIAVTAILVVLIAPARAAGEL